MNSKKLFYPVLSVMLLCAPQVAFSQDASDAANAHQRMTEVASASDEYKNLLTVCGTHDPMDVNCVKNEIQKIQDILQPSFAQSSQLKSDFDRIAHQVTSNLAKGCYGVTDMMGIDYSCMLDMQDQFTHALQAFSSKLPPADPKTDPFALLASQKQTYLDLKKKVDAQTRELAKITAEKNQCVSQQATTDATATAHVTTPSTNTTGPAPASAGVAK